MRKFLLYGMILFLLMGFSIGCSQAPIKFDPIKQYSDAMIEAEKLAAVLCSHSEFSAAFWKASLDGDMSMDLQEILTRIDTIIKGKQAEELSPAEKGELMGLWMRFTAMLSKETILKIAPKLIAAF